MSNNWRLLDEDGYAVFGIELNEEPTSLAALDYVITQVLPEFSNAKYVVIGTDRTRHTLRCIRQQHAVAAYRSRWPKACKSCEAKGGVYSPDTWVGPGDWELCSKCLGAVTPMCPRCATELLINPANDEPFQPCQACGWAEDEKDTDPMPPSNCECWEKVFWRN